MSNSEKLTVCLIFGGRSGEHEVSLQSAASIYNALDKSKYNVTLVGVDKAGRWHLGNGVDFIVNSHDPKKIALNLADAAEVASLATQGKAELVAVTDRAMRRTIDVVFPIIHGTTGEDGSLQGLLEMADVAYVGAGVLGSAVGMDKDVMKRLLREAGLPIGKFITIRHDQVDQYDYAKVVGQLGAPFFVKPANTGSSVGITKVKTADDYSRAIKLAFNYDRKVILEEFIPGREIECSVLGDSQPIASLPGEVVPKDEFYTYKAKYIDGYLDVVIPAQLSEATTKRIQNLAIQVFRTVDCEGMARVDFFVTPDERVLVNELNTLPGFTALSMYPKMWQASGIAYADLLDRLIVLALKRKAEKASLRRDFNPAEVA